MERVLTNEKFVGRKVQLTELREVLNSRNSEFVAVYGRRRVGKTFLIREAANNDFTFFFTAAYDVSKKEQLTNFAIALQRYSGGDQLEIFENWFKALSKLGDYIDSLSKEKNKIIFFDELPWADTPKSGFLGAFENFWNTRCAFREDIKLVVCGSATSWIINKVIHNKGGLHGRITHKFMVEPFDLYESKEYFEAYGWRLNEKQIAEIYMVMGGIPYYFSLLKKGDGMAKNIDNLFFSKNAILKNEFEKLYAALFKNPSLHLKVVKELGKKGYGMTRQELVNKLKITGNGSFSMILKELEECGFIRSYLPFEKRPVGRFADLSEKKTASATLYQLIDLYSLFYLRFAENKDYQDEDFWTSNYRDPKINTWRGLAFETLCLWHVGQIKHALGISGISAKVCSWLGKDDEGKKAQIDLLLDRRDDVINVCEMKYSSQEFVVTKKIAEDIERKVEIFLQSTKTKKNPVVTLITPHGLKKNEYSDIMQKVVSLEDLFHI